MGLDLRQMNDYMSPQERIEHDGNQHRDLESKIRIIRHYSLIGIPLVGTALVTLGFELFSNDGLSGGAVTLWFGSLLTPTLVALLATR